MDERSVPQTQSNPPQSNGHSPPPDDEQARPDVCLTDAEWQEISDCCMALSAALFCCHGLEGDEPAELVKSVYYRFEASLTRVRHRVWPSA